MLKQVFIACVCLMSVAAHADCLSDVDALAAHNKTSAVVPHVDGNAADTETRLAQSGGVIAPPRTNDTAGGGTQTPLTPDAMETAPELAPQIDGKTSPDTTAKTASAQDDAAALLQAARQKSSQGDENGCKQNLAKARALLENSAR